MSTCELFQIYYDEASRRELDSGFTPLDNRANPRPDWFELWPIREYLRQQHLRDDCWYGFFSPKFASKTGLGAAAVRGFLAQCGEHFDVALFSPAWDQIAYFLNPFEQGEVFHPGITRVTQRFIAACGVELDLSGYTGHSLNSVFSNFIVARPAYWKAWSALADQLVGYVEAGRCESLQADTTYGSPDALAPMKTFVQERLASVLLATGNYRVAAADLSGWMPVFTPLFQEGPRTRRLLRACDAIKLEYAASADPMLLDAYLRLRALVPCNAALPQPLLRRPA